MNESSNRIYTNDGFINDIPNIVCNYVECNSINSEINHCISIIHINARDSLYR